MITKIEIAIAGILLAIASYLVGGVNIPQKLAGGNSGITAAQCTLGTATRVTVGNQASSVILAAAGNRAWAMIQSPSSATNTVAISLGGTPTIGSGIEINSTSTDTTVVPMTYFTFGRNTDLPYTGAINGLTNLGSTTIQVVECLY